MSDSFVADKDSLTTPESAFREFRQALSRFLIKRLDNSDDVQDLLQEVFVRVMRNEDALMKAKIPLAWLYSVTQSVLVDHFRKTNKALFHVGKEINEVIAHETDDQFHSEFDKCLRPLIDSLPENYRKALIQVDLRGHKQTDFAEENNLNHSTVKSRVQRGRKILKQAIINCCSVEYDNQNHLVEVSSDCTGTTTCC